MRRRNPHGFRSPEKRRRARSGRSDGLRGGQVAPHKKIRAVEFVDAIPKTPSGKILRRVLKDRVRARAAG